MNTWPFAPGIELILLPSSAWIRPVDPDGTTLDGTLRAVARVTRKMSKGLALQEIRTQLPILARRIDELAWKLAEPRDRYPIPPDMLSVWNVLLANLARQRAQQAARQLQRPTLPPFLPSGFLPSNGQPLAAGAYGSLLVTDHLAELEALEVPQTLGAAVRFRRQLFQQAAREGTGVIEIIGHSPTDNTTLEQLTSSVRSFFFRKLIFKVKNF